MSCYQTGAVEQAAWRTTVNDRRVLNGVFWFGYCGPGPANYLAFHPARVNKWLRIFSSRI
jgi:hypothetical protein